MALAMGWKASSLATSFSPFLVRLASSSRKLENRELASVVSLLPGQGCGSSASSGSAKPGRGKKSPSASTSYHSFAWALGGVAVSAAAYLFYKSQKSGVAHAKSKKGNDQAKGGVTTLRQLRFKSFASVAYGDDVFMTPRDFIESLTETMPRSRATRRVISNKELDSMYSSTPPTKKGSSALFRKLQDQGIISYTEYLFLLSILTKPQSGFQIAFNMFDTDGNQRVDKHEFLVLKHLVAFHVWRERTWDEQIAEISHDLAKFALERIFSMARKSRERARRKKNNLEEPEDSELATDADVRDDNVVNTTLLVHFFGTKGNGVLSYEDFRRFMENLQTEVLEIEFHEFSKGLVTISEVDFAKILLRYTLVHSDDHEAYLSRLQDRISHKQGITFAEFKAFCQFLNNLDDFAIAMRMYTLSDQPISRDEFNRAVKICTGESLSDHLVRTVFQIFDEDGDGHLSYKEFIAIMRDRLHRGFRPSLMKNEGWVAFKSCVREEMKAIM